MKLAIALLLLVGCAVDVQLEPAVSLEGNSGSTVQPVVEVAQGVWKRAVRGSCVATFDDVAAAWEATIGPLSAECRAIADTYRVELVDAAHMPCPPPAPGQTVYGCSFMPPRREIYLLDTPNEATRVYASAHEWVHVIAGCEGSSDRDHSEDELWAQAGGVFGLAVADMPVGPCLE